jgi:hypothetical protein
MMKKSIKDGTDQYLALLEIRNTPRQDTLLNPVQMLLGRETRTMLPSFGKKKAKHSGCAKRCRELRRATVKQYHDKTARDRPQLKPGQPVFYQKDKGQAWRRGTVERQHNERSYQQRDEDGASYRRNKVFIRPDPTPRGNTEASSHAGYERLPPPLIDTEEEAQETVEAVPPSPKPQAAGHEPVRDRPQCAHSKPTWMKEYVS